MRWARVTFNPHLSVSLEETEVLQKEVKRYSKMDSSSSSSDESSSDEESLKRKYKLLKKEQKFKSWGHKPFRRESRTCHNCGKVGHLMRNCKLPKKGNDKPAKV